MRQLEGLAVELRRLGLSAVVDGNRRPRPGLRVANPARSTWIAAGTASYWWDEDPSRISPLDRPAEVARQIVGRLSRVRQ